VTGFENVPAELVAIWDQAAGAWRFAVDQADIDAHKGAVETFTVSVTEDALRRPVFALLSALRGVESLTARLVDVVGLDPSGPRRTYPCSRWIGASGRAPGSNRRLPETSCPRCGWARAAHAQALTGDGLVRQQGRGAA
jgi:hypothetical protein